MSLIGEVDLMIGLLDAHSEIYESSQKDPAALNGLTYRIKVTNERLKLFERELAGCFG